MSSEQLSQALDVAYERLQATCKELKHLEERHRHESEVVEKIKQAIQLVDSKEFLDLLGNSDLGPLGYQEPARRIQQKVADQLLFIGTEGKSRKDIIEYTAKEFDSKDTATRTMLYTYSNKYGFLDSLEDSDRYVLSERGVNYLKRENFWPSEDARETPDAPTSDVSVNTPDPDEERDIAKDLKDLEED